MARRKASLSLSGRVCSMGVDDSIEAEAEAQAICMQTKDYERAYEAFVRKEKPVFLGN